MRRRPLLERSAVALSIAVAGCLDGSGPDDETSTDTASETATETGEATTPPSDIHLRLVDLTSGDDPAVVSVTMNGDAVFEGEVPDGQHSVDLAITREGRYDFAIAVENGPKTSQSWSFGEYALEHGLDVIAEIRDDEIRTRKEE